MAKFPAHVTINIDGTTNEEYTPSQVTAEQFIVGDFVVWDQANAWVERAGADPAKIMGISEVDSEKARVLTPNGKVPIRHITTETIIAMSSETEYVEATHRNKEYGITRDANGIWQVDTAKTGAAARVSVVEHVADRALWRVKFLGDAIAVSGIDS